MFTWHNFAHTHLFHVLYHQSQNHSIPTPTTELCSGENKARTKEKRKKNERKALITTTDEACGTREGLYRTTMTTFIPEGINEDFQDDSLSPSFDNNATDTFEYGSDDGGHNKTLGVLMLALFAVAINMILFLPPYFVRRRRMRQQQARRLVFQAAGAAAHVIGGESKDVRYYKIESWVVSKKICAHDEVCEKLCRLSEKPRIRKQTMSTVDSVDTDEGEDEEMGVSNGNTSSSDDSLDEANERECPICFDTFEVDDIASWSADSACKHVFHHRCIKEWLVNHKGCPFCRATFLPIDRFGSNMNFANLSELIVAQEERSLHCYYCVNHGIVSTPKHLAERLDHQDWTNVSQRAREVPDRSKLYCMRGPAECPDYDIEASMEEELVHMGNDQELSTNAGSTAAAEAATDEVCSDDLASSSTEDESA